MATTIWRSTTTLQVCRASSVLLRQVRGSRARFRILASSRRGDREQRGFGEMPTGDRMEESGVAQTLQVAAGRPQRCGDTPGSSEQFPDWGASSKTRVLGKCQRVIAWRESISGATGMQCDGDTAGCMPSPSRGQGILPGSQAPETTRYILRVFALLTARESRLEQDPRLNQETPDQRRQAGCEPRKGLQDFAQTKYGEIESVRNQPAATQPTCPPPTTPDPRGPSTTPIHPNPPGTRSCASRRVGDGLPIARFPVAGSRPTRRGDGS